VFDYSFKAGGFEGAARAIGGRLIGIGADLHVVKAVSLGIHHEGGKLFLLQLVGHLNGVALLLDGGDLQKDAVLADGLRRGRRW
jgi:hypothetical protein